MKLCAIGFPYKHYNFKVDGHELHRFCGGDRPGGPEGVGITLTF